MLNIYAIKVTTPSGTVLTWDDHILADSPIEALRKACLRYPYSHDHAIYMEASNNPKDFRMTWQQERDLKNILLDIELERCD